jgi:Ca2+-binding RTX toxin-like protein
LREATLKYEAGGGGWVSYAYGIFGGFTIANGATIENANGGAGNDGLIGNKAGNLLIGRDGNDQVNAGGGDDTLQGGDGVDRLFGGGGQDTVVGGAGRDALWGNAAGDRFVFLYASDSSADARMADHVRDFDSSEHDTIDLRHIDADATLAGNQNFDYIDSAGFTGAAGQLHYSLIGGNTLIEGDTDGNGAADFAIWLNGVHELSAGDFVL